MAPVSDYTWNAIALVPLASLVACVLIATVILRKNPRWSVSRAFLALLVEGALFNLTEAMLSLTRPEAAQSTGHAWGLAGWLVICAITPTALLFGLVARRNYMDTPRLRAGDALLFVPGAVLIVALASIPGTTVSEVDLLRPNVVLVVGPWTLALGLHNLAYFTTTLVLLWDSRRRTSDPGARSQLKFFIVGFAVVYVQNLVSSALVTLGISYGGFPNLSFSMAFMLLLIGVGVVRYRLFDIRVRVYLRRALIVALSTAIAVCVVAVILTALSAALGPAYRERQAALSVAVLLPTLVLIRQWERLATLAVERLSPSMKWKESETGDVFLVSNTGLLITHIRGASRLQIEGGMLAGMLTAIQDFVGSTIGGEGEGAGRLLSVLTYGETKVLIEHGRECYMVVVFDGFETEALRSDVQRALRAIHDQVGEEIAGWDGGSWIRERVDPVIGSMLGARAGANGAAAP